jgi:hypothetical protein
MKLPKTILVLTFISTAAGCATSEPVAYEGLASAAQLRPDTSDKTGRSPYSYRTQADWRQYNKVIVEPVTVYRGKDGQFGKMAEDDRFKLASYMQGKFAQVLQQRYAVVSAPGPATLRVRATLTGGKTTDPVLGPLSHIDVAGGVYNTVQSARGKEGSMTGSASYAVEVYDSVSNQLLLAYVEKQYPNALNIGANFAPMKASYVAIDKGANDLLARLR